MFTKSADFYDLVYTWKNYPREVEYLMPVIRSRCPHAKSILDVACGTGEHLRYFSEFERIGIDLDSQLLKVARGKSPDLQFIEGDMVSFDLHKKFDVVLCLFSAIGYAVTIDRLNSAVASMARHLNAGGVLCIEPWFTPESWDHRKPPSMVTAEREGLKVCRIFVGGRAGNVSTNMLHYLVAEDRNVEYFTETHNLGLFTEAEMRAAFQLARLTVELDPVGPESRGLYIGMHRS